MRFKILNSMSAKLCNPRITFGLIRSSSRALLFLPLRVLPLWHSNKKVGLLDTQTTQVHVLSCIVAFKFLLPQVRSPAEETWVKLSGFNSPMSFILPPSSWFGWRLMMGGGVAAAWVAPQTALSWAFVVTYAQPSIISVSRAITFSEPYNRLALAKLPLPLRLTED